MSRFRFSAGPWNVHPGADAFGPTVREAIPFEEKVRRYKELGFSAVQFHDDDAVPEMHNLDEIGIKNRAREVKALLDRYGMAAEFVAPRLWDDPRTGRRRLHVQQQRGPKVCPVAILQVDRHRQ